MAESAKATKPETNHLIIGLGGTGGKIIRSLRKLIFQNLRQEDPSHVNLRYLYIDTDSFLMRPDSPSWKILGRSVQLPERSQMYMSGMNLKQIVDNLANYPNLQPWLGDRHDWEDILKNADAANLQGGQKRRLGRFLFAGASSEFVRRVGGMVTELHEAQNSAAGLSRSDRVTFHVCCGLAGGTGSGSVCDVVTQIRKNYPGSDYRIVIYALLPERHTGESKGGPNYHANGYAALVELNSLVIGGWKPHDVAGSGHRLDLQDLFNCCYLFHDENDGGVTVNVDTEIPEIVGSFLYQKLVEMHRINWGSKNTLVDQETFIVGGQAKQSEQTPKGKDRRSRSFFAFGIKQIAYPEVEISEYMTYSFARQAVLQQLYNNWVEGQGYQEVASNQSFNEFVRDKPTLVRWSLTEDCLTLSDGILADETKNRSWQKIPEYWRLVITDYVEDLIKTHGSKGTDDKLRMLPELEKRCEKAFNEQYRGAGVKRFYELKRGDMRDQVREIRGRIETDLFAKWKEGDQSMFDVSRLVSALVAAIEERISGMDDKILKASDESEEFKKNEKTIKDNRVEWSKLNLLSMLAGKDQKLLRAQGECHIIYYRMRTQVEGLRYAKDLLSQLRTDLQSLSSEVSEASAMVAKAAKTYRTAIDNRCADQGSEDLSKQVIRFYDPQKVKDFAKSLTLDRAEQKKQTSLVRTKLTELLLDKQTFTAFNSRITEGQFLDVLESSCDKSALEAHEEFISKHPDRQRILRLSVMELLRKEFDGSPERLRSYAQRVMEHARNYLKFDQAQIAIVDKGIPAANDSKNAVGTTFLTVIAPEAPEAKEFRENFCNALKNSTSAQNAVVSNPDRPQEVTLLSVTSVFPARFVAVVDFLKKEYDKRLYGTGKEPKMSARAFLELHSEGDAGKLEDGQELYSLYPETYKPSDLYPWLLIANAMNVIRIKPHAITKLDTVYLTTLDADGIENDQELGMAAKDGNPMKKVLDKADIQVFETLKDIVEPMLANEYPSAPQREEVLGRIRSVVQDSAKVLGSNHPDFIQLRAAFDKTKGMLTLGG